MENRGDPLAREVRLINRAKTALMEKRGLTEAEAHRFILKTAMDRCIKKTAVAEQILQYLGEKDGQ